MINKSISYNIVLTGTSSGIGSDLGNYLTKKGHKVIGLSRRINLKNKFKTIKCDISNFKQLEKVLIQANNFVKNNNSKLFFVYLPDYPRYKSNNLIKEDNYKLIKKKVKQLNIPFIDIHEDVFQKETNKLKLFPFEKPGHYNEYGYYKVATAIYNFIVNNNN